MFGAGTVAAQAQPAPRPGSARGCPEGSCCGSAEAYARSGLIEDLPGCEGEGKDASADRADQALREAKGALLQAQRQIAEEARERSEEGQHRVDEALAYLEGTSRDGGKGADRLKAALPLYQRAAAQLKVLARLLPELDGLRSCHAQAQVALRPAAGDVDLPAAESLASRTEECVALLRRLLQQKQIQESLGDGTSGLAIEIAPGEQLRLHDLLQDVRSAHKAALQRRQVAQKADEVVRGRWLRVLFGDRLRIFNQHGGELPDYDGKARGPLPASVAPRWRYRTPEGKVETYLFRRNKVVGKTLDDTRRS